MNKRGGNPSRIVAGVMVPWLARWVLLRDSHQRIRPPGEEKKKWIHVVCPEGGCTNEAWVTMYEPGTVKQCGQHDGPRRRMVRCGACEQNPGFHPKPGGKR